MSHDASEQKSILKIMTLPHHDGMAMPYRSPAAGMDLPPPLTLILSCLQVTAWLFRQVLLWLFHMDAKDKSGHDQV